MAQPYWSILFACPTQVGVHCIRQSVEGGMALWGPKLSLPLLLPDRCFGHRPARRHGRWAYDGTKLLSYAGSEEVTLTQAASAVEWTHVDGEFTCPLSVNVGRGQTTLKIQFTDKTIELGSETPNQDQTNVLSAITQVRCPTDAGSRAHR